MSECCPITRADDPRDPPTAGVIRVQTVHGPAAPPSQTRCGLAVSRARVNAPERIVIIAARVQECSTQGRGWITHSIWIMHDVNSC